MSVKQSILQTPIEKIFCSWSGGKDSSLALFRAIKKGYAPNFLLTMMIESGERSRSHGIPKNVLEEQAKLLNIPILFCSTSWEKYTERFLEETKSLKSLGTLKGIFGDIDIEIHRQWVENTCSANDITPWIPLWQSDRKALLEELFGYGFQAEIIAVKDGVLPPSYLGRVLTPNLIKDFKNLDIDLCGEVGEYHTLVTNGPCFKKPLEIIHKEQVLRDGYWFSDVSLKRVMT